MREVEALRDQLLAAFEELPGLSPRDVAVMAPSMDAYAPYVEAVFGVPPDDPAFVPYSIADRHPRTEQALVDAFLALVELLPTRLTGPEVLEVLSRAPIRERFGIPPEGMEILTEWLDAAGIRWAVDARDRAAQGQPALDEYTWRFGLDRLLLGFAASGDQWTTFAGRVPLQGAEGAPGLLGSLLEFSEALFEAHRESLLPARPAKWQERLLGWLEGMFHAGDEHAWQRQSLRDAFEGLATDASLAGFDGALELADLRFLLEARVGQPSPPREFLSSGISFCSLLPMRSVPFRVIALLGLSEEQFPRQDRRVGFDLMAEAPRPGDPSPRQDDRYLFLETMLAARDRLILSYVGGDLRDQTARPPSVLVSELLDVLGESFVVPEEREREPASGPEPARERRRRMAERLVVRHSLRPFDPRYFGGPGPGELFTFNRSLLATARAHLGPKRPAAPFLAEPLPPPSLGNRGEVQAASASPAELTLPLDSLERFWRLPAEQLMRGRLGLSSPGEEPSLSHREPASIESGLHAYQVRDSLLGRFRASGSIDGAWEALLGAALLPLGEPGRAALEGEEARMKPLLGFLAPFRTETPLSPVPLALPLGPSPSSAGALFGGAGVMRLAGWLRGLLPGAQLMARPGEVRPKDQLAAWLRHLALSALGDPRLPGVTIVAGAGGRGLAVHWFERVEPERAIELLRELAVLFWDGQRVPLRFFPGTSLAYAEGLSKGAEAALASARAVFLPSGGAAPSDSEDPYVARFFRGAEVLEEPEGLGPEGLPSTDHAFASLAIRVWGPLLEARREGPP
jgi:exodeoxyribonuclease V gamma subunit